MGRVPGFFAVLLTIVCAHAVFGAAYDPAALSRELRRLESEIAAGRAPATPGMWEVETEQRHFSISTAPLRALLDASQKEKARAWVDQVAGELEGFALAPSPPPTEARAKLKAILTRPEFHRVREPTAWDRLRERIRGWFARLIERLLAPLARHPEMGTLLFWLFITAVAGAMAVWLFRTWTGENRAVVLSGGPVSFHGWEQWLREAHAAETRGDFSEGIRCSYWAGIACLQEAGIVSRDSSRTPREYLRIVAQPGAAAGSPLVEPLHILTASLERFWYARIAAGPEDFRDSLSQLEALRCKLG